MSYIDIDRVGETTVLRLNRPPVNAIDLELTEELDICLSDLETDMPAGGLVLTGEGATFCSGVDFKAAPTYSAEDKRRMVGNINGMVARLYALPTATVAAVNGHAIGGGLVLALTCDFRLFADGDCKLGLTEVAVGIPYPACPMEVLKAELPAPLRRGLVLSGRVFGPRDARDMGIADELGPADGLIDRAAALAAQLAAQPSYTTVKRQLRGAAARVMKDIVAHDKDPMLKYWV